MTGVISNFLYFQDFEFFILLQGMFANAVEYIYGYRGSFKTFDNFPCKEVGENPTFTVVNLIQ